MASDPEGEVPEQGLHPGCHRCSVQGGAPCGDTFLRQSNSTPPGWFPVRGRSRSRIRTSRAPPEAWSGQTHDDLGPPDGLRERPVQESTWPQDR